MTVLKYILLSLAIAVCLFFSMLKRFGWAHYHRWTFFITKTEAKLSGQWLDKYLHYHSGMYFVMALFFFLYFFQKPTYYNVGLHIIMVISWIHNQFYFKKIAADEFRDREV